jgi:tetratricopeptide (TPR) repeat protein
MRIGYWTGEWRCFTEAEEKLVRVAQDFWPNYGFALFDLGRIHRLRGQFTMALDYFARALAVPEPERDVTTIRVRREIYLATERSTRYP